MNDEIFDPRNLKNTILNLLNDDKRDLAWNLIDHYYSKAFRIDHFDILGYASLKAEKRDTYLKCAEAAYSIAKTRNELYASRVNLIKAYNTMNYPEKALFYIEKILTIEPDDVEMLCLKAFNISLMGNKKEAEKILTEVCLKYPDKLSETDHFFAGKYLREGQTAKGILSFVEAFKPKNKFFEENLKMSRWDGIIRPTKKLYVDIEGGIGDQIINIRFFDKIKSYGMKPILVSYNTPYYKDINNLLRRHNYDVLTDRIIIDRSQLWVPMMSIPGYMGMREQDLWKGTYLTPLRNPKNKLHGTKPKIGIKCSGNPYFSQDEYRKIPIKSILNILPKNAEIYYIDSKNEYEGVINLKNRINSWEDTLDFIDQMDCIVSSCTSLVHAAGAIGKTTFVAVPIAEYYIWTSTRTDGSSPWYGENFYVAKQKKLRDWTQPLSEIKERVHSLLKDRL